MLAVGDIKSWSIDHVSLEVIYLFELWHHRTGIQAIYNYRKMKKNLFL